MPNPIFPGWYADPEIHFFQGRYWIYPTISRPYEEQTTFDAWHSEDLVEWTNVGTILDFADVPWSTHRAAWAPSCAEKNGKYYFYFSAGDGAGLGVAVADSPAGPFRDALGEPLVREYHFGAQPIDAHAFVDDDGRAYLYWGGWKHCVMAELADDMLSFKSEIREITPEQYVEGPFMIRRRDEYVFMWSEGGWGNGTYCVAYARSTSPWGPFEREGLLLCNREGIAEGAGHHSVVNIPGTDEYVVAYHRRIIGDTNPHHRVVCLDRLVFREDRGLDPVLLTNEGVDLRALVRNE